MFPFRPNFSFWTRFRNGAEDTGREQQELTEQQLNSEGWSQKEVVTTRTRTGVSVDDVESSVPDQQLSRRPNAKPEQPEEQQQGKKKKKKSKKNKKVEMNNMKDGAPQASGDAVNFA